MSTIIKYNDAEVFSNQPTPMLTSSVDMLSYGQRWGQVNKIKLEGQLTGVDYSACLSAINQVADGFSENFKDLEIVEDSVTVVDLVNCKVESISFDRSTMSQLVDYSVSLSAYSNFSGTFGVLDPQEKFSFSRSPDDTASLTHEVSAVGFKTGNGGNNAFVNARNYVQTLTGWKNSITPAYVNDGGTVYPILVSTSENIDRFAGSYGVTETYVIQEGATSTTPTSNFSTSFDQSLEDDVHTVSVNLVCNGGKSFTLEQVRTHAYGIDLYSEAKSVSDNSNLLSAPVSFSVDEDPNSNSVTVKATYDDDQLFQGGNAYLDSNLSFDFDIMTGLTTISVSSKIIGRGNNLQKWNNVIAFLENNIANIDDLQPDDQIVSYLLKEIPTQVLGLGRSYGAPICRRPTSVSMTKNRNTAEVSISATFNDRDQYLGGWDPPDDMQWGFDANYTVDVTAAIPQLRPNASCNVNGYYIIYDLNARNREKVAINLTVQANGASDASSVAIGGEAGAGNDVRPPAFAGLRARTTVANSILDNIGARWLGSSALVDSENQSSSSDNRELTVTQNYSQDWFNVSVADENSYIPINTSE